MSKHRAIMGDTSQTLRLEIPAQAEIPTGLRNTMSAAQVRALLPPATITRRWFGRMLDPVAGMGILGVVNSTSRVDDAVENLGAAVGFSMESGVNCLIVSMMRKDRYMRPCRAIELRRALESCDPRTPVLVKLWNGTLFTVVGIGIIGSSNDIYTKISEGSHLAISTDKEWRS